MPCPIIFIDIDGPLMPGKQWFVGQNRSLQKEFSDSLPKTLPDIVERGVLFDQAAVQMFNLWIKYSNAKIVLSTYWSNRLSKEILLQLFDYNGLYFTLHDDWCTPKRFSTKHRGNEIAGWLSQNDHDKFLIVDDDKSIKDRKELDGNSVMVNFDSGLTSKDFTKGCTILGIDIEQVCEDEFGIKKLTEDEKKERETAFNILSQCCV